MDLTKFDYNLERDVKEHEALYKNRAIYSLPARVGDWNEKLSREEQTLNTFQEKRARRELLIDKTKAMFETLLRPVPLSKNLPFVEFGKCFQLKALAIPSNGEFGVYLNVSADVDVKILQRGGDLTASPEKAPCVRNVFVLRGSDKDRDGECVYYGQDVFVQPYSSDPSAPLYVHCENVTADTLGDHLTPELNPNAGFYARFKVLHWNPKLRESTIGSCFAPGERVIIQHAASGMNLAVECNKRVPTLFGLEFSVTCHTFKDTRRVETGENVWKIVQHTGIDKSALVRATKGEEISMELLEG